MISIQLDPDGRMIFFKAVPPQIDAPSDKPPLPDWAPLFAAAGIDQTAFTPTESTWVPEPGFDTRSAWTGAYADQPDIPMRIEAAAYRGKPVYFNIIMPWQRPSMVEERQETTGNAIALWVLFSLFFLVMIGASLLARHNLRRGRGDRRGAFHLAFVVFSATLLAWLFGASHAPTFLLVGVFLTVALSQALLLAGLVWLIYISLEPFVRRRWPDMIISWSRVLGGSLRDPLVGRDLLIGVLAGVITLLLRLFSELFSVQAGVLPPGSNPPDSWLGSRQLIAGGLSTFNNAVFFGLFAFFLIFVMRLLMRRKWLTAVLCILLFAALALLSPGDPMIAVPFAIISSALSVILLLRFGLLASITAGFVLSFVDKAPVNTNFSAWYGGYTIAIFVSVMALAVWAFHTSLGGQKLFEGGLLDE